jgi:spore coat polysaccharide biosynthesis protein SpsF
VARTIRIVIQARMNSSRLPHKIAADVAGQAMLAHTVRRLQAAAQHATDPAPIWEVMVATTKAPADDVTDELCQSLAVPCFRESEHDVLGRYVAAAADLDPGDALVRATGDNPLYCPRRTASIVAEHVRHGADYTCIENLSYVVPEVIEVGALRKMADLAADGYCREHVTPYFRQPDCGFRVVQLPPTWRGLRPLVRLTVDTPAELERMRRIAGEFAADRLAPLERIYEVYDRAIAAEARLPEPAS